MLCGMEMGQQDVWIVAGVAVGLFLLLLLACVYVSALGRMVRKDSQKENQGLLPPVTVIMAVHNQRHMLEANLPAFLFQHYSQQFEVMVADQSSSDGTLDLLEQMEQKFPHLHHTFVPSTARDVSRQRLALMLAIKGASYDHVMLTVAECSPSSPHWLSRMASAFSNPQVQVVLGPSVCMPFCSGGFPMFWQQMMWLVWGCKHAPYRSGFTNVGYDRRLFMQHNGFASHAGLVDGAVDIMVNQNATRRNTRVCVHPDAVMTYRADRISRAESRLFYMETRRHFTHGFLFRLHYAFMSVVPWLFHAGMACVAVAGGLSGNLLLLVLAGVLWLSGLVAQSAGFYRSSRPLGIPSCLLSFPLRWLAVLPEDVCLYVRYLFADKSIFRKRFI